MNIAPIRSEQDYQKALLRLEDIFDSKKGTEEGDELKILSILIDQNENFPIGSWQSYRSNKISYGTNGLETKRFSRFLKRVQLAMIFFTIKSNAKLVRMIVKKHWH